MVEGIQRIYYHDDLSREATIVFTYSPSFSGVIDSLFLQTPSKYFFETLTASTLYRISHSELEIMMEQHLHIMALLQKAMSITIAGLLERLVEMQSFTSEEKFINFFKRSPHMLHLIPQKYLANYLGIDYTNFSKFINRIKI